MIPPPITIQNDKFDQLSRAWDENMTLNSFWIQDNKQNINVTDVIHDVEFMNNPNFTQKNVVKAGGSKKDSSDKNEKNEEFKGEKPDSYNYPWSIEMTRDRIQYSELSANCVALSDSENDELAVSGIFFQKLLWIKNRINDTEFEEEYSLENSTI